MSIVGVLGEGFVTTQLDKLVLNYATQSAAERQ